MRVYMLEGLIFDLATRSLDRGFPVFGCTFLATDCGSSEPSIEFLGVQTLEQPIWDLAAEHLCLSRVIEVPSTQNEFREQYVKG